MASRRCKNSGSLRCDDDLRGFWVDLSDMNCSRERFAAASGPDISASGPVSGINSDPRVYAIGGLNNDGDILNTCEKYNPNDDSWTYIANLPSPLEDCSAAFVPNYAGGGPSPLGYMYVVGGGLDTMYRYNISTDSWESFDIPFTCKGSTIQYLDDFGGPLSELLQAISGTPFPSCSDTHSIWVVGGEGTEQRTRYVELDVRGDIDGSWKIGPTLPLKRFSPLIGRTFWRDAGVLSFGVSNCASVVVCGGSDNSGLSTKDVQLLIRQNGEWRFIWSGNNDTNIPNDVLWLKKRVSNGAFGTEQWPETLVTGGRPILFGGNPIIKSSHKNSTTEGTVQYAQFRFVRGRLTKYPQSCTSSHDERSQRCCCHSHSQWSTTTPMPMGRTGFHAAPLSQDNPLDIGGRRVSRFLCIGGRDENGVLKRTQMFLLPTPDPFVKIDSVVPVTGRGCCQNTSKCKPDQKSDSNESTKKMTALDFMSSIDE